MQGAWPAAGTYRFQATAVSGAIRRSVTLSVTLPARPPALGMSCTPVALTIRPGEQAQTSCTVTSMSGSSGTVHLGCPATTGGVTCADTRDLHLSPGASITAPLTVSVPSPFRPGQYMLVVKPSPDVPGSQATGGLVVTVPAGVAFACTPQTQTVAGPVVTTTCTVTSPDPSPVNLRLVSATPPPSPAGPSVALCLDSPSATCFAPSTVPPQGGTATAQLRTTLSSPSGGSVSGRWQLVLQAVQGGVDPRFGLIVDVP